MSIGLFALIALAALALIEGLLILGRVILWVVAKMDARKG